MAAPAVSGVVAVRAAYGAVLLSAPGAVVRLYSGHPDDRRSRRVARLLGARHLTQAVLTVGAPSATVRALGVEADLAHAVSMLGLAAGDRSRRRAALIDAVGAASFAAVGALLARRTPPPPLYALHGGVLEHVGALREVAAALLAPWLLPASLRHPAAQRQPTPQRPAHPRDSVPLRRGDQGAPRNESAVSRNGVGG